MLALMREHAGELLRFARRFSICVEDAQDAHQRALEKLIVRMRGAPPANVLSWLRTVLRHECLAIRAEREKALAGPPLDEERDADRGALDPAERVERFERLAQTAEALRGLKPQELQALALRAEGLSYREICERTSWTYTRCNRAISEGRRALLSRLRAIESGAECERWLPALSRFADGEAASGELAELRRHLRGCPGCRATLRDLHALPAQLSALLPIELLPIAGGAVGIAGVEAVGDAGASADAGAAGDVGAGGGASASDGGPTAADGAGIPADGAGASGSGVPATNLAEVATARVGGGGGGSGFARQLEALLQTAGDRAGMSVLRFQAAIDALPGTKFAAVAASTVAVAGGGAAIEQAATAAPDRPPAVVAAASPTAAGAGGSAADPISTATIGAAAPPAVSPAADPAPADPSDPAAPAFADAVAEPFSPGGEFALERGGAGAGPAGGRAAKSPSVANAAHVFAGSEADASDERADIEPLHSRVANDRSASNHVPRHAASSAPQAADPAGADPAGADAAGVEHAGADAAAGAGTDPGASTAPPAPPVFDAQPSPPSSSTPSSSPPSPARSEFGGF